MFSEINSDFQKHENLKEVPIALQSEVKFCDVEEGFKKPRKNLMSAGSSESESSDKFKKHPHIPDGGYGWIVVISSLVVSLIADGISFSFGLIYTELLVYFNESKSKTAWIGSLFLAVPLLVGPIMSNLVDKYGCRKMTIIGGLISSTGFALSSLCQSVEMLFLTFGIISGIGLGIGYVTAVVSIAFWFEKKRTFATGIGASGTGIGTFLYAPFTQWLIDYYGWRGATLVLAGTMLHTCVFGALMRDPDWLIEENKLDSCSQSVTTFSSSSVCLDEIKKLLETGANKESVLDTLVTNFNTEANQQAFNCTFLKKYQSEMLLPTYFRKRGEQKFLRSHRSLCQTNVGIDSNKQNRRYSNKYVASIETLSSDKTSENNQNTPTRASIITLNFSTKDNEYCAKKFTNSRISLNDNLLYHDKFNKNEQGNFKRVNQFLFRHRSLNFIINNDTTCKERDALLDINPHDHYQNCVKDSMIAIRKNASAEDFSLNKININKKNIRLNKSSSRHTSNRNSNFLKNMRIHRHSIHYRGALLNTHRYRLRASSCPNIFRNSMTTIAKEDEDTWYDNFKDTMKSAFDFSLFLDLKFALFNLSTLLLFIWFIIPYFYIPEHMKNYGYTEEDSAKLISIIGIFNTIGMVGLGFIGDRSWLNVNICYALCMIVCGVSVGLMPIFVESYGALIVLCTIFGLTFASSFSFTPSILVSLVDLDDFTCAYGLVLLVQGIGIIVGPPLAAFMYDMTLRWDDSFYGAGFFITLSGILAYFIEILEKRDRHCLSKPSCGSK
ncbi:hypothetical protein ACFFRR_009614 [Megaselia abdita]